jgi:hypothetical protein
MKYQRRQGVIKYHVPEMTGGSLPHEALATIEQCDSSFMAARHLAADPKEIDDMDVNHRGGKPGTSLRYAIDNRIHTSRRGRTNSNSSRLQWKSLLLYSWRD